MKQLFLFLAISIVCSCKNETKNVVLEGDKRDSIYTVANRDSFNKLTDSTKMNYYLRQFEDKLILDKLRNGYDSFQLRIWFLYNMTDTGQLLTLKYDGRKVDNKLYTFIYRKINNNYLFKDVRERTLKSNKNSILNMMNFLRYNRILSLRSSESIEGYPRVVGGQKYVIEIANKNFYKYLVYKDPEYSSKELWQAESVASLLAFVEQQFNFKRLYKSEVQQKISGPFLEPQFDKIIDSMK